MSIILQRIPGIDAAVAARIQEFAKAQSAIDRETEAREYFATQAQVELELAIQFQHSFWECSASGGCSVCDEIEQQCSAIMMRRQ